MVDEINFVDLACLFSITPDTTLEKFGSSINASIFDASNLAGSLKQKSLIDFSSYYPGPNTIVISDAGKALMAEAESKSTGEFDKLDQEILFQVSGGKRLPIELQNTLNIRSKDLAMHVYKLFKQGLLIYELKSGGAALQLTESGFIKAKAAAPAPATTTTQTTTSTTTAQPMSNQAPTTDMQPPMEVKREPKPMKMTTIFAVVVLIIIIIAVVYYLYIHHIL